MFYSTENLRHTIVRSRNLQTDKGFKLQVTLLLECMQHFYTKTNGNCNTRKYVATNYLFDFFLFLYQFIFWPHRHWHKRTCVCFYRNSRKCVHFISYSRFFLLDLLVESNQFQGATVKRGYWVLGDVTLYRHHTFDWPLNRSFSSGRKVVSGRGLGPVYLRFKSYQFL